jgi:hypothetical protein
LTSQDDGQDNEIPCDSDGCVKIKPHRNLTMKDFNGNVKDASAGFNRSVANIGEAVERETAELAAYLNNEVVPAVRGRSSKALQVTAQKLSELAEDLNAEQRKEP